MEKSILLCNLYDYYNLLLTDKQRLYFTDYYFENLSLSEMAENYNVSRNAIHNLLKDTEEKLIGYEEKLKLFYKKNKIKELLKDVDINIQESIEELI